MANDLSTLMASLREAREGSRELDRDIYEFAIKGRTERVKRDVIAGPYTTDLTAAVALLAALPSCEGWRPVSEAPKEKMTSVLVAQVGKPPVRAFWYDDHWHLHGSTQRLEADLEPTHWMPLPSPPERKEK